MFEVGLSPDEEGRKQVAMEELERLAPHDPRLGMLWLHERVADVADCCTLTPRERLLAVERALREARDAGPR